MHHLVLQCNASVLRMRISSEEKLENVIIGGCRYLIFIKKYKNVPLYYLMQNNRTAKNSYI